MLVLLDGSIVNRQTSDSVIRLPLQMGKPRFIRYMVKLYALFNALCPKNHTLFSSTYRLV